MTSKKITLILLITVITIFKSNAQERMGLGMVLNGNEKDTLLSSIVLKRGPMAKAGLLSTDLLQAVNGKSLLNMTIVQVLNTLHNEPPNNVKIDILRNGKSMSFTVNKVPEINYDRECTSGNCKDGTGTLTFRDGQYYYVGLCKDNKIIGPGKLVYKDGETYEGNFLNEKKHGYGRQKIGTNYTYDGTFKENKKHGFGTFQQNEVKFRGFFNNGSPYFLELTRNDTIYFGYFTNNKMIGYANIEYKNGTYYKGEIKNRKPNGLGFLVKNGKEAIIGEYKNGQLFKHIDANELGGFSYYPSSNILSKAFSSYYVPFSLTDELSFYLEDSKSNFSFLLDRRTKRKIMNDEPEAADSKMPLTTTLSGQFEFDVNGESPYYLAKLFKTREVKKLNDFIDEFIDKMYETLVKDYILVGKPEVSKPEVKKLSTTYSVETISYTYKFISPLDSKYEMRIILLDEMYSDGEYNVRLKIPSATKK